MQGSQAPQPDTRKQAVPLTPPQRKTADPKPESKKAENAPSSSQLLPRPTASKAPLAQVARSSSNELAPAETQPVDEQFLRDLMSANLADIESQLEIQLEGRTAVDHIPDGLSTLSQYLLYRQQLLDNPFPEQWVMAPWQALRSNAARTALVRKYQRPFASLKDPERFRCAQFLLSLFPEPVADNTIGQEEFFGFVDCILQSRLNYERHFQEGASLFHNVEENVVGYRFKCVGFPGPPVAAQNWHLWAHATTREGATGILATGKILPTDHQVADLEAHEDTFSFFGRSMSNPDWNTGVVQLACKCFHSTKNCSGVVFAGLLPSGHVKGKSASTSYENNLARFHALVHSCSSDKRWAIRFAAARIDFVFVLSDRNKANYPRQENPPPRKTGPKAISTQPTLALTDGHVDESWGRWSLPPSEKAGSPTDVASAEPDTDNLMATSSAFN